MSLQADPDRARVAMPRLIEAYRLTGIFGHRMMPEEGNVEGLDRGSREHANLITLTVAIDYLRDADGLWRAAGRTWRDPSTRWLFDPVACASRRDDIRAAMAAYELTWRFNRDPETWWRLAVTLRDEHACDAREILARQNWDAERALILVRSRRTRYPFLSGPKILPLWLRMMSDACGLPLKNLDRIPIPVDVHIARASLMLGAVRGRAEMPVPAAAQVIDSAWQEGSRGIGYYPLQADQPLWLLSKYGCSQRGDGRLARECPMFASCPVADLCVDGHVRVGTTIRCDT